jgi:hypothetical protein
MVNLYNETEHSYKFRVSSTFKLCLRKIIGSAGLRFYVLNFCNAKSQARVTAMLNYLILP